MSAKGWRVGDPPTDTYADADTTPTPEPPTDPHEGAEWQWPDTHFMSDREVCEAAAAGDVAGRWEAATRGIDWKDAP